MDVLEPDNQLTAQLVKLSPWLTQLLHLVVIIVAFLKATQICQDLPRCSSPAAKLIAVCPPNCTITPSGCSSSITSITSSTVNGSKYNLSEMLKSVETVSGLLFMIIAS